MMSTSSPEQSARLTKHVRKIARYEGITEGQGQVLLAAADAFEASLAEVEALEEQVAAMVPKSWGGLIELLNEAYPDDVFITLPDDASRDQGPRILSLVRLLDRERSRAEAREARLAEALAICAAYPPTASSNPTSEEGLRRAARYAVVARIRQILFGTAVGGSDE